MQQAEFCDEQWQVITNRFLEARAYGFTRLEARQWAESNIDSGKLRRLKQLGCPPRTAAKVLLP